MNSKELADIANFLRRDVLKMTSAAGSGHPTSCLSCAEIISALFFDVMKYDVKNSENPDNDEFILSKGHAAPILYSALKNAGAISEDLMKLRKLDSKLEGHPVPSSLKWVKVATGSLGQGLGVGVGFALSAKKQNRNYKTYVLLGDSEMSEGSNYEAMQLASFYGLNNLVAIVDVNRLGQRGETMVGKNSAVYKKRFEAFGWECEIVDGHDAAEIAKSLRKNSVRPFALICETKKGKGVSFLEDKNGWHGKVLNESQLNGALMEIPNVKIPRTNIGKNNSMKFNFRKEKLKVDYYQVGERVSTREAYGEILAELALSDGKIIAIDGEVSNSTFSEKVEEKTPEQFVEAFIAEQNMVSVGLGMSKKGYEVFCSSFAAFLSRAHDQIRMAALSSANLTFVGSHSGVSIGEDGASQMGLEDISIFRALPNSFVFYPSDGNSTKKIIETMRKIHGVKYLRTTRGKTPMIYTGSEKFEVGDFKILSSSKKDKVVICGAGITLHEALRAQEILATKGILAAVLDIYCVKPFDAKKFLKFVSEHGKKIVVAEDHRVEGGIGEMLSSVAVNSGFEISCLGVEGIPHSGTSEELLEKFGIDASGIVKEVGKILR